MEVGNDLHSQLQSFWSDAVHRLKMTNTKYPYHFIAKCIQNSPYYIEEEKYLNQQRKRKEDEDEVIKVLQNVPEDAPMHDVVLGRRFGISAEPITADIATKLEKSQAKSLDQRKRIENALSQYAIFTHLDCDDKNLLLDAMTEVQYEDGATIIKEGEEGDNFYVIDDGLCDLYKYKH